MIGGQNVKRIISRKRTPKATSSINNNPLHASALIADLIKYQLIAAPNV